MKLVQARKMLRSVLDEYAASTVVDEVALYLKEKAASVRTMGEEGNEADDFEMVAKMMDKTRAFSEACGL